MLDPTWQFETLAEIGRRGGPLTTSLPLSFSFVVISPLCRRPQLPKVSGNCWLSSHSAKRRRHTTRRQVVHSQ